MVFECLAEHSAELFIVEGKHAANAVNLARDKNTQAVLAMQGKVPNVAKSNLKKSLEQNVQVRQLDDALQSSVQVQGSSRRRYEQVVILSDPDADGLHAAVLLVRLIAAVCPPLIQQERLLFCRSPLYRITTAETDHEQLFYSKTEMQQYRATVSESQLQYFKGVASIPTDVLARVCVNPASRKVSVVSAANNFAEN